jgi:hypothetical protein
MNTIPSFVHWSSLVIGHQLELVANRATTTAYNIPEPTTATAYNIPTGYCKSLEMNRIEWNRIDSRVFCSVIFAVPSTGGF